jgi:F0F1-type ATP synthase assembly protein I
VEEKESGKNDKSWTAASLAWELGYIITIPLVVLALLGRYLDKKMGTSPWLLLLGLLIAIFTSSYGIYKKSKDIIEK